MFSYFLFFVAGAVTMRIAQFLLGIKPNYLLYKQTELTCIKMMAEYYLLGLTTINVAKVVYMDTNQEEDFAKVEKALNNKYEQLINSCIEIIKSHLPYKVKYNSLQEALETFKKNDGEKNG